MIPSLSDYTKFHGMLCSVGTARRCIDSFDDGVALFADQSVYDKNECSFLATVDYNHKSFPFGLTVWSYYLLVLFSLTGTCTLFGQTKVLRAEEGLSETFRPKQATSAVYSKETKETLCMPPHVFDYIRRRSANLDRNDMGGAKAKLSAHVAPDSEDGTIVLKRRFEYDFGGYISVMMLHFECSRKRMHLVEVYRLRTDSFLGRVVDALLRPLRFLDNVLTRGRLVETNNKEE